MLLFSLEEVQVKMVQILIWTDSAVALEIADFRAKVNALLEKRDVPLDGEDDRSAGGRRLVLHDRTIGLLPDDIYRQELLKDELAKILRSYPFAERFTYTAAWRGSLSCRARKIICFSAC